MVNPKSPTIASLPEDGGDGINAAEATDGTTVEVVVTDTGAVVGDTLTVNWGAQPPVAYILQDVDIAAGSVAVAVPVQTIQAQGEGSVTVTARLTAQKGNASSDSAPYPVVVDMTPPAVSLGSQLAAGGISTSASFTLTTLPGAVPVPK